MEPNQFPVISQVKFEVTMNVAARSQDELRKYVADRLDIFIRHARAHRFNIGAYTLSSEVHVVQPEIPAEG